MGGSAVVDILFGHSSPSGRLTVTIYPEDFAILRNMTDMRLEPHLNPETGALIPGITYLYYDGPVLWPFGFGGSYTSFSFTWLGNQITVIDADRWVKGEIKLPEFAVAVTNDGLVISDISVLAFIISGIPGQPLRQLVDFQRGAQLHPNETITLYFTISLTATATTNQNGEQYIIPGEYTIEIGDIGTTNILQGTIRIQGDTPVHIGNM